MNKKLEEVGFNEAIARFSQTDPKEAKNLAVQDNNKKQYGFFEGCVHNENGVEFWYVRDLMKLLGYTTWKKFLSPVKKAVESCKASGHAVGEHFIQVETTSQVSDGSKTIVLDLKLTRYACYLIAQNGDTRKLGIAFAQTYFAVQTRAMEVIQQRMAEQKRLDARNKLKKTEIMLSSIAFQRGVKKFGFGKMRAKGDKALFGGNDTKTMKKKLGITKNSKPLADVLPTVSLKAKDLAAEITRINVEEHNLQGEPDLINEHVESNTSVRKALTDRKIYPEFLPPAEDIKKVEGRHRKEQKAFAKPKKKSKNIVAPKNNN